MSTRSVIRPLALMFALAVFASCKSDSSGITCEIKPLDPRLPPEAARSIGEWPQKVLICDTGQYQIVLPAEPTVDNEKHIMVIRMTDDLAFQADASDASIARPRDADAGFSDQDKDGRFDLLTYSVRHEGEYVTVMDRDLDGQADIRTRSVDQDREMWLWIETGWYLKLNGTPGVTLAEVDGKPKRYEVRDKRFVFVE